ncbi:MAG: porin [Deltaproteobacteria bacterium]|nr:porin [Deltaproteobacteria bacterium]
MPSAIRISKRLFFFFAAATVLCGRAGVSHAQGPAVATTAATPEAPPTITVAQGKGLSATSADGRFSFGVRGRIQLRETIAHDPDVHNETQVRTFRFFTYGHLLSKDLQYLVQLAFGAAEYDPNTPSPVFDAFVDYKLHRDVQLRVGQYFVVFDRARTIRESSLHLVDRQQAVQELNLDRDVGLTVMSNDLFGQDGKFNYAFGIYGGNGRNRTTPVAPAVRRNGYLYTGRVGFKPFGPFDDDVEGDLQRLAKPRLALGLAAAFGDNADRNRGTIGTAYQQFTFDYKYAAADLVFKWHGVSLMAEALTRQARVDSKTKLVGTTNVKEWSRSGWGYLFQAGVMITSRVEVAARWDELRTIGNTDPTLVSLVQRQGREVGGGINVYLNGHFLKLQADYAARFGSADVDLWQVVRLQLDASF